jgi:cation diffusion facilitator CzcD-associated flavoprotein CzcO/acetyl esterase/lipase
MGDAAPQGPTSAAGRQPGFGSEVDVVVVGAGMAGLYQVHLLRQRGFSVLGIEAADDVGGTWYWNRYPGARCDIVTTDYCYSFDPELEEAWQWSEKYATQPEILDYLRFVADRYDLRRSFRFSTKVSGAVWDEAADCWTVTTDAGDTISCRFLVLATGCLSVPKTWDVPGVERFTGETYVTGLWPRDGVDFAGKRVGVIGTGSSGIQCIPEIAKVAAQVVVFQRTPNFSAPAHHGPQPATRVEALARDRAAYRHAARWSRGGVPSEPATVSALAVSEEERRARLDQAWAEGELFSILNVFADQGVRLEANEVVAEYIREQIRAEVHDPEVAEALSPRSHPFGTKRPCLDDGYYATFNRPNVRLVDLRRTPIVTVTEDGVQTSAETVPLDVLVLATGFDAMTGALLAIDPVGRDGRRLSEAWVAGPTTYLGLAVAGFPNLFTITGPGSPSVLSNMAVSIEQHVEWVTACLEHLRAEGFTAIEPTEAAQAGWDRHCADCAAITLHPLADSWYMGANVEGKPRTLYPYIGGVDRYRKACDEVAAAGYLGFERRGPQQTVRDETVVCELQPDVAIVLDLMAQLGLPPLETLSVDEARATMAATTAVRPPGPPVAQVEDRTVPGAAGPLPARRYVPGPDNAPPRPLVVWFHGGGWVLGDLDSDDPLCRDLCVRLGAVVLSVNYRHAPEHRFPAAAEDAVAALSWAAEHAADLGADPAQVVAAGWSAGGNLAAVACQQLRDRGGPPICAQLLLCPVTDCDLTRPSYRANAEGYILTEAMMHWFWDLYAEPADRTSPLASPLRGSLEELPPAVVVTAQFDPLHDDGAAYAEALDRAGTPVVQLDARGHTHTSLTMVDAVISGAPVRAQMTSALEGLLGARVGR